MIIVNDWLDGSGLVAGSPYQSVDPTEYSSVSGTENQWRTFGSWVRGQSGATHPGGGDTFLWADFETLLSHGAIGGQLVLEVLFSNVMPDAFGITVATVTTVAYTVRISADYRLTVMDPSGTSESSYGSAMATPAGKHKFRLTFTPNATPSLSYTTIELISKDDGLLGTCVRYDTAPSGQRLSEIYISSLTDIYGSEFSGTPNTTVLRRISLGYGADFEALGWPEGAGPPEPPGPVIRDPFWTEFARSYETP